MTDEQLRLAAFLRERYFCTFYECLRVMLPAGLWFQARERISLTGDRSWKEKAIRKDGAAEVLALLENLGGQAEESALRALIPDEETLSDVIAYLARKKWISAETEYLRRANDKTEKIAALAVSAEEAMEYASHRPKSAAMQKNVLELMCGVGSVSVKELCYFTGASTATVNRWKTGVSDADRRSRSFDAGKSVRQSWTGRWCSAPISSAAMTDSRSKYAGKSGGSALLRGGGPARERLPSISNSSKPVWKQAEAPCFWCRKSP